MRAYLERTGLEFEARFYNTLDEAAVPVTAHWRLDCATTQKVIRDWTPFTVSTSVNEEGLVVDCVGYFTVPSSANAIQDDANAREQKNLVIIANKDLDNECPEEIPYMIRNLQGRT